jgi:hypothetical protein
MGTCHLLHSVRSVICSSAAFQFAPHHTLGQESQFEAPEASLSALIKLTSYLLGFLMRGVRSPSSS